MEAIFEAVRAKDMERLEALLVEDPSRAAARREDGLSVVLYARYHGAHDTVARLLRESPSLDVFDAAAVGRVDRLTELVGADPSLARAWSADGYTALHLAVFFRHADAARELIEAGSDVRAASRNDMQVTPLHSAVAGRDPDSARVLVEHGADVDATSHGGWRPLHSAAQHGDTEIAEILLAHGADPTAANDGGQVPAETAAAAGHGALAARLREAGSRAPTTP